MGRKKRRDFYPAFEQTDNHDVRDSAKINIDLSSDVCRGDDLRREEKNGEAEEYMETTTRTKSTPSAKKKKRRKKQKQKYKLRKRSQIRISISRADDLGQIDQDMDEKSSNGDGDDSSTSTVKTSNGSFGNSTEGKIESFQQYAAIGRIKKSNGRYYRKPNHKKLSSRKSDCFNQVLWSTRQQIRYSWLNDVSWIGNKIGRKYFINSGKKCKIENEHKLSIEQYNEDQTKIKHDDFILDNKSDLSLDNPTKVDESVMKSLELETNFNNQNQKRKSPSVSNHLEDFNCSAENDNTFSVTEEIAALSLQLHEIKTRLWPASIKYANLTNDIRAQDSLRKTKEEPNNNFENSFSNTPNLEFSPKKKSLTAKEAFEKGRRACNPFEELGEGRKGGLNNIFLNRSAMKLVNMDAMLDFSILPQSWNHSSLSSLPLNVPSNHSFITEPILRDEFHHDFLSQTMRKTPFRFVDLCGAPGGFTEYVLRQCSLRQISVQGWGLSLIGENESGPGLDWKLQHLLQMKEAHFRVCVGADGTGDILTWENVEALRVQIMSDCHESECLDSDGYWKGNVDSTMYEDSGSQLIDLVVADGGCQAQRDSSQQEGLTMPMVVSEVAAGLSLLKPKGKLIVKMFGFQSPPIKAMLRYLYNRFEKITAVKPILSRPASAERYLICFDYLGVEERWDGLKWRDDIIGLKNPDLMDEMELLKVYDEIQKSNIEELKFENHFSTLDRDILELNIKSCFGILSYLERKQLVASGVKNIAGSSPPKRSLDIDLYRREWKLY